MEIKGNIAFRAGMDIDQAVRAAFGLKREVSVKSRDVAFHLKTNKKLLGEQMNIEDILKGETSPPGPLLEFLRNLIQGPDTRRGNTETKHRRIQSTAQDICYWWEVEAEKTFNARVSNEEADQQSKGHRDLKQIRLLCKLYYCRGIGNRVSVAVK